MKTIYYVLTVALGVAFSNISLSSCSEKTKQSQGVLDSVSTTKATPTLLYPDTSVTIFGDPAYKLTLRIFDEERQYDNALLSLTRSESSTTRTLLADTLSCQFPDEARQFKYE